MANVKIEILDAVVDGNGKGAVIEVEAKSAQYLANIGYVRIVDEKKETPKETEKAEANAEPKAETKPAKSTKSKASK